MTWAESTLEWRVSEEPVPYLHAVEQMERRAAAIREAGAPELIWLLQHPPLYTAGTSARTEDLLDRDRFPVYRTGRGGQFTYHGPGQRVAYVHLDLSRRRPDVRAFVRDLEEWVILTLKRFGIRAERRQGRIGLWVRSGAREDKIAAIGVRLRKWVSYHGLAINLDPDLSHFAGIVPCGIAEAPDRPFGVTSLAALGVNATLPALDLALAETFAQVFGDIGSPRLLPAGEPARPHASST
jgi:lipoyl(octanoyl) transferase